MITVKLGGQVYRIDKIPAIPAKALLDSNLTDDLSALRKYIYVKDAGEWLALSEDTVVVEFVANWEVLAELELKTYEHNYAFLSTWVTSTIPGKMKAKFVAAEAKYADPVVTALVTNNLATYKELRDEYSLEEAFILLDILTTKKINEYRATEATQ